MSSRRHSIARRALFTALLWVAGGVWSAAIAQDSAGTPPCRFATMIVGAGAGSGSDLIARALIEAVNRDGKLPEFSLRNIDANNGIDAAQTVRAAAKDGCTVLLSHQVLLSNFLSWRAPFAWHDFRRVAMLTRTPMALVSRADLEFADGRDLIQAAREGEIAVTAPPGSIAHFSLMALSDRTEVTFNISLLLDARERLIALLSGEVDALMVTTALARRLRETQRATPLAITDWQGSTLLTDVGTLEDQGVNFNASIDLGAFLPPGTSAETTKQLSDRLEAALQDRTLLETLSGYDVRADFRSATQYTIYWENLMAVWREVAVEAGYERSSR